MSNKQRSGRNIDTSRQRGAAWLNVGLKIWLVALLLGFFYQSTGRKIRYEPDADQRGRFAESPVEMTWLGWKDIALRMWREIGRDRLFAAAASVAFFTLLAMPAGLSALVAIFGLIADPHSIPKEIEPLIEVLPKDAQHLVRDQALRIASQGYTVMSFKLALGLSVSVWSANAAVKAIFDALNVIYAEVEKRSFLYLTFVSIIVTISAVAMAATTFALLTVAPQIISFGPETPLIAKIVYYARWPFFFTIAIAAIGALYWIGPSRQRAKLIWVAPGAILAAILWALVSAALNFYASHIGHYEAVYGSLAAVILFMTWLWVSAVAVLIGAELNRELELQTTRDTTLGDPKPLGSRGAAAADGIGDRMAD